MQARISVESDKSVFVVVRKPYHQLKIEVESLNVGEYYGLNIRGPVGVGKSYLLYLLAADYRMNRSKYRVTYIHDCKDWVGDPYPFFLEELVITFYDDVIVGKSILEWCQEVMESAIGSDREEMFRKMIQSLVRYVKDNDLQWIVIIDQHNALFKDKVFDKHPFTIIHNLAADMRGQNVKVIISASANNEGYPNELKGWLTHDISSHRFDDSEFQEWCDHYRLEDNVKVNPDSEEACEALFWTGWIPFELNLVWYQPEKSFAKKIDSYRENRVQEMILSHEKFVELLSDELKSNAEECVSRMALGLPPPWDDTGMDRELLDITCDENDQEVITALNPLARIALISHHGLDLLTCIGLVAELILKDNSYTNDLKGRMIEKYIITTLELTKRFSFQSRKIGDTGHLGPVLKNIDNLRIAHFSGNKLPLRCSFNKSVSTLFVPVSCNYPGFDFFIWNDPEQVLMAFHVTVKNPFTLDSKMSGLNDHCQLWLDFCFNGMDQNPIEVYWIIPESCIGNPNDFKDHVILFEDLYEDLPALRKLDLNKYF